MNGYMGYQGAGAQGQSSDDEQRKAAIMQALMGRGQPQNMGQGMEAMGKAIAMQNMQRNSQFPTAPGGADPSFETKFLNMLTRGRNGGMY